MYTDLNVVGLLAIYCCFHAVKISACLILKSVVQAILLLGADPRRVFGVSRPPSRNILGKPKE